MDRRTWVAKTINNWLQSFIVLGGATRSVVRSSLHIWTRCIKHIGPMAGVYGGATMKIFAAVCLCSRSWAGGIKVTDVWLGLMIAQKTAPFPTPNSASVAHLPAICDPIGLLKNQAYSLTGKTPVNMAAMAPWLDKYPDASAATQLRGVFLFGFFISFTFRSLLKIHLLKICLG